MRRIAISTISLFFLIAGACSSAPEKNSNSDITNASGDNPQADSQSPPPETSEGDISGNPPPETGDQANQQEQPPAAPPGEEPPPPPQEPTTTAQNEPPPPAPPSEPLPPAQESMGTPVTEPTGTGSSGSAERITGLDFDANLNGGTIIVKTSGPISFATRKNEGSNQFVVEMDNVSVPKQFRRPYITKDFSGPVASINAYQSKGGDRKARIIVQLKTNAELSVAQEGNKLIISQGAGAVPEQASAPQPEDAPSEPQGGIQVEDGSGSMEDEQASTADEKVLKEKTLADFLSGNVKFFGRRISLQFKDTELKDVFQFIAEEVGVNILVGDDVQGKITLRLRSIPWDQALSVVLQAKKLGYVKQGNVIRIATLKNLDEESKAAKEVIDSQKRLQPIRVQLYPISYAKAEDLEPQVKELLSGAGGSGKVKHDKRTNTLIVADIDEVLLKVKSLVQKLDTQTPQVLIEAKVVEARENFGRTTGVSLGAFGQAITISGASSANTGSTTFTPLLGTDETGRMGLDFRLGTFDVFGNLTAQLKLLETEEMVKVISSPRIVTLDREKASIEQTLQFPVFSTILTAQGQPLIQTSYQDAKLQLDVTPQITFDGGIIMKVSILREFPGPVKKIGDPREINKRKADTQVLVENGNTMVLGGIYQSDVGESESGTPWLRKIPIIGFLFRNRTIEKSKNELVIFLTPRVLNKEKAFVNPDGGGV